MKEAGVSGLEAAHEEHVKALNDLDVFVRRDMAFHQEIARMTGNPIYPALIEAMFDWLGEYYAQLVRAPGAEALTLEEHGGFCRDPGWRRRGGRGRDASPLEPREQPLPASRAG